MTADSIAPQGLSETLRARLRVPRVCDVQPVLHPACGTRPPLGVVLGSLAVGGAERIVLDWAQQNLSRYRIQLCVLRDERSEWPVPEGLELVRLRGRDVTEGLKSFARGLRHAYEVLGPEQPRVLCHMTRQVHRQALEGAGVSAVAVLHNAREGWKETAQALDGSRRVIAVSQACMDDLHAEGRKEGVALIRHLPRKPRNRMDREVLREQLARTLGLPRPQAGTRLLAMVGGIKSQKNYVFAVEVLAELARDENAYLVIFGGPVGADGPSAWAQLHAKVHASGLQSRIRLPGFVPNASVFLSGFDAVLNTSVYEGLSIATLEALVAQVPVVAARVGGQGEVASEGLSLLESDATATEWAQTVRSVWSTRPPLPAWASFPAHRLWTLEHLVCDVKRRDHVLFVTANLNAGGAQRSLVNLTQALQLEGKVSFEVAVTGCSSARYFLDELRTAGVVVSRTGDSRDCFDHAEALLSIIARSRSKVVCFWNVDPKVKLLLAKVLPADVRLVDVSPGAYAFEEMGATESFQQLCGFTQAQFNARLDRLVFKYDADRPRGLACPVTIQRNGVPLPLLGVPNSAVPRVVVNGRIASSKFVLEIVEAMRRVWERFPMVRLELLGAAEERHADYADEVLQALDRAGERAARIQGRSPFTVHGPAYDLGAVAARDDIAVVLGHHQGCPNAVLEAMAHRLAVIANDSGGTREMVRTQETGVLLRDTHPQGLATALCSLIEDTNVRRAYARAGRAFVKREFSMKAMVAGYSDLFESLFAERSE